MLETKDDAAAAVKRILDGNESPFDEYNKTAKLRDLSLEHTTLSGMASLPLR